MKIAIYLGSHDGNDPIYCRTAYELGRTLAQKGIGIVYGGANVGTMGSLARGAADAHGECIGVFPEGFKGRPVVAATGQNIRQEGLTDFLVVKNFAERKQVMEDMSDCCLALPGSWGTMDELFTYATSSQLLFNGGKRIFILNTKGFYDPLKAQIGRMYDEGFIDASARNLFIFCETIDDLIEAL